MSYKKSKRKNKQNLCTYQMHEEIHTELELNKEQASLDVINKIEKGKVKDNKKVDIEELNRFIKDQFDAISVSHNGRDIKLIHFYGIGGEVKISIDFNVLSKIVSLLPKVISSLSRTNLKGETIVHEITNYSINERGF